MVAGVIVAVGVLLGSLAVVLLAFSVKIIPEAHAGMVERWGRYVRTLDAGIAAVIPIVERVRDRVDLSEQVLAFPSRPVITADNVTIDIDTVFFYSVTDPYLATYGVADVLQAIEQLTITTLRNVIGSLSLEATLTGRDHVNADLQHVLAEATSRWGIRVNRIEIKSIDPPDSIQQAMEKQMRAERDRRAVMLAAEGEKGAAVLVAEGDRQAKILRAEGDAEAIRRVFEAIHAGRPTPDLLAYAYLQTLPEVADGQATTVLLMPQEALGAMGVAAALGQALRAGDGPGGSTG
jgi:regulator of protease activity HflC (stomatin/prohibitin superfamily)